MGTRHWSLKREPVAQLGPTGFKRLMDLGCPRLGNPRMAYQGTPLHRGEKYLVRPTGVFSVPGTFARRFGNSGPGGKRKKKLRFIHLKRRVGSTATNT